MPQMKNCPEGVENIVARLDALEEALAFALDDAGRDFLEARLRTLKRHGENTGPFGSSRGDRVRLKVFRRILSKKAPVPPEARRYLLEHVQRGLAESFGVGSFLWFKKEATQPAAFTAEFTDGCDAVVGAVCD